MNVLYAFQGTGNGHVARARDLVPKFARQANVDVLVAGTQSDLDLGFPIKYQRYGLAMVYNSSGAVSYWKSLLRNKPLRFLWDVIRLPVDKYDLIVIDFESICSYACMLRNVPSIELSHQAAYLSKNTPRPSVKSLHWEFVLKYLSPSTYKLGFHFAPYDSYILPPIIRKDLRDVEVSSGHHYTVYLPSFKPSILLEFLSQFPKETFHVFTREKSNLKTNNATVFKIDVIHYAESFKSCKGLICGAGFEAPSEAVHLGKKLMVCPVRGQYEQESNAIAIAQLGAPVFSGLNEDSIELWQEFFNSPSPKPRPYPDYASALVGCILNNVKEGRHYDDISSLQVW